MKKSLEFLDWIDHDILQMAKPNTRIEYSWFTMRQRDGGFNSYEREFLYEILENKGLVEETENLWINITMFEKEKFGRPRGTYEEVLLMNILPLTLRRLREARELAKLCITFREHENKVDEAQQGDFKAHVLRRLELLGEIFALAERVK